MINSRTGALGRLLVYQLTVIASICIAPFIDLLGLSSGRLDDNKERASAGVQAVEGGGHVSGNTF